MRPTISVDRRSDEPIFSCVCRIAGQLAGTGDLFRTPGGSLVHVEPGYPGRTIEAVVEQTQATISRIADFTKTTSRGEVEHIMPPRDIVSVLMSGAGRELFPLLRLVVQEPVICLTNSGGTYVTAPGFDPLSGIYYNPARFSPTIVPSSGVHHLTTCFSGVPFLYEDDRRAVFAWLLGSLVLDARMSCPLLAITGNTQNIGKTVTMQAIGNIVTGRDQAAISTISEEFEKQVSTRFLEGSRFIGLDNVVSKSGSYRNSALARILTDGWSKKVRVLGASRSVEQSGVLFALSANDCQLDSDLATRSLPVRLHSDVIRPMEPFVLDYAREHRTEIYSELLGLALLPDMAFAPTTQRTFRFRFWLSFVFPRIAHYFGAPSFESAADLNDLVSEIASWGLESPEGSFTSIDLLSALSSAPAKFPCSNERFLKYSSETVRTRRLAIYLSSLADKAITLDKGIQITLRKLDGFSESRRTQYVWEKVVANDLA